MILPAEVDDALDALRTAREAVGNALDELNHQAAPVRIIDPFTQSLDALSWCIERVAAVVVTRRDREQAEAVEERRIDCGTFDWVNET